MDSDDFERKVGFTEMKDGTEILNWDDIEKSIKWEESYQFTVYLPLPLTASFDRSTWSTTHLLLSLVLIGPES